MYWRLSQYQFVSQTRAQRPDQSDEICPSKQYRQRQGAFSRQSCYSRCFHARGSLLELQTEITFGCALGFLTPGDERKLTDLASEVGRLLNGLVKRFQSLSSQGSRCCGPGVKRGF